MRKLRLNSFLKMAVLIIAVVVVVYNLRKQKVEEAQNEATPQISAAAQQAAEENYEKQNEFRRHYAENPEKPEAGYATIRPTANR